MICVSIVSVILVGEVIYSYIKINSLSSNIDNLTERLSTLSTEVDSLTQNLASTTASIQETITETRTYLSNSLSAERDNVGNIQRQLGNFQNQVGNISGTVNTLQKLAKTDPELLKKYSKVYFLNENYVPARLSEIPSMYEYSDRKQLLFHTDALPHLEAMINTASTSGVIIYTFSAYRSFAEQRALKADYRVIYGAGTANSFSADQGYSEHQLGTAVDFITPGLGGVLDGFDNTKAYQWLINNAYRFGFVISYPKNNGYYVFEPWHWRYVGVKLATEIHDEGKNFYEMDQKTIDQYLVNIFD